MLKSNVNVVLGLFAAVALSLGAFATVQTAAGQGCPVDICGTDDPRTDAKKFAAQKLRENANAIQSGNTPDPPKSEIVNRLNDRANQLDPDGCPACG